MLFEDKLGKEQSLLESCLSSDSENVGFVELRALITHCGVEYVVLVFNNYKSLFIDLTCGK